MPRSISATPRARRWFRTAAATITIGLALTLVACQSSGSAGSSSPSGKSLTDINVGYFPTATWFSTQVAQQKGFFVGHGLNVKFVTPQDGPTFFRLTIGGRDINIAVGDGNAGISFKSQGQDVKLLGTVLNKNTFQLYAANAGWANVSGDWSAKLKALRGKTIGVPGINSAGDTVFRAILKAAGLNPDKDVTIVALTGLPAVVSQLKSGAIDAYVYQTPFGGLLEQQKAGHTYIDFATDVPKQFSDVPSAAILVSGSWLKNNPGPASEYVAAEAEAVKWILDPSNTDEAVKIFNSSFLNNAQPDLARQVVTELQKSWYSGTQPNLAIPPSVFDNSVSLLTGAGQLKSPVKYNDIVVESAQQK